MMTDLYKEVSDFISTVQAMLDSGDFNGVGIQNIIFNPNYTMTIILTNGSTITSPSLRGEKGDPGDPGQNGTDGLNGTDGKSAYQIWLDEGNEGTEQDFLNSLKGADGQDGINGTNGRNGQNGTNGQDGYTPQKRHRLLDKCR